jgi:hypothetical protein
MPPRKDDDDQSLSDAAHEPLPGDILRLPLRRTSEQVGRTGVLQAFRELGFPLRADLQKFLRLPPRMVRGIHAETEFYDPMSMQPFPMRQEDAPAYCFDRGLAAPTWVRLRYVSVVRERDTSSLVFIDAPRDLFLKEDLSCQDAICEKIYDAIVSPSLSSESAASPPEPARYTPVRIRNDLEARILSNREANLRNVADAFGALVAQERAPAPAEMQLEARKAIWELSGFRAQAKSEMAAVVRELCKGSFPPDYDLRIARLALAMYWLDKTQEMLDASKKRDNPALTSLFQCAFEAIRSMLDRDYFTKSSRQIIDDYLDNEATIRACASCSGVELTSLELAVKRYMKKVADEIDSLPDPATMPAPGPKVTKG